MREIKFRAKTFFTGTLGSVCWMISPNIRLNQEYLQLNLGGQNCDIETLGQYTGQKDKNGNDIFEGDILHTNEADWIAKVIWHYDGFMLTGLNNTGFSCSPDYNEGTIIGNIYDNPELLGTKNE